ncbi:MAG: tetratricopeptide repeat protein [Ardenticatenaceae bacterium]|nr:tetratricopeptide repeat protein [Ardenticatenaceae bacterium]
MTQYDLSFLEQLQSNLDRRKNPLAKEIHSILDQQEPKVAVASAVLSIPRRFNEDILATLLRIQSGEALLVFDKLKQLSMVSKQQPSQYVYRPGVREVLIAEMRTLDNELFLDFHRRAYQHYSTGSPLMIKDKLTISSLSSVEGDWLREQLYHLLVINPAKGFELFDTLFIKGYQLLLDGDPTLLESFGWQASSILLGMRDWLRLDYYEPLPAFVPHHIELSIDVISPFVEKDTPLELRGWALARLGTLYTELGQCDIAVDLLQESLQIWQISNNIWYEALLNGCLGNAYFRDGDLKKAKKYLNKGIVLLEKSRHYSELAIMYNNLGNVYSREENWNEANRAYQKSLSMKQQQGDLFGIASTKVNIGIIHHRVAQETIDPSYTQQQLELASQCYQDSITLFRKLGIQTSLVKPLYKLAVLYFQQKQLSLARASLREALQIIDTLSLSEMHDAHYLAERIGLENF